MDAIHTNSDLPISAVPTEKDFSFKIFFDLMAKRVSEILLVSSPYDAFIMEEDGRLAERIIHEYRGLNLTRPPRLTFASTAKQALKLISKKEFNLVITMPRLGDMPAYTLGKKIKKKHPDIPIILLSHNIGNLINDPVQLENNIFNDTLLWRGDTDLLVAIIKNQEDRLNVAFDTQHAQVRVIILVEDSPIFRSSLLPLLYKEIVMQTQAVMEESLNEEHRILRMRARPKILVAKTYEECLTLYHQFKSYLLCIFSDVRFPLNQTIDDKAGIKLLEQVKSELPDLPVLILSSEDANRKLALEHSIQFLNKTSLTLHKDIRNFLEKNLGFGDFIFRFPNGKEFSRVPNLRSMEKALVSVPDDVLYYHAVRNDFSTWLMARSEIQLASKLKPVKVSDFPDIPSIRQYLIASIRRKRIGRQQGVITDFIPDDFDPETDFLKIGRGSIGGKARGLAFITTLLAENQSIFKKFSDTTITIPRSLVVSTEGFDAFIAENDLKSINQKNYSDRQIQSLFIKSRFPDWLRHDLKAFLSQIKYPLAVRSSSLLEDTQYMPCAGIYNTYMIPNNHADFSMRLDRLLNAIKLVYASIYLDASKCFEKTSIHRTEEEKMAVIIQQIIGKQYDQLFYPAISGVAQSFNYYPISPMTPEDGIAHIALGLGRTVVEGESALRFCPRFPQTLPAFSTIDDILKNAQHDFYALDLTDFPIDFGFTCEDTLKKVDINDVSQHYPVTRLSSSYSPEDHRIRDIFNPNGYNILTFANILKYQEYPIPDIIFEFLKLGKKNFGCPVEIEFAVNLPDQPSSQLEFSLVQIRPMATYQHFQDIDITPDDISKALCYSENALGNGEISHISHILYIDPDLFEPAATRQIAELIRSINSHMASLHQNYLLIGPGRWGSADPWLGIPVKWNDISQAATIIELSTEKLKADPSQGSHFFHNITSLGIGYLTVSNPHSDFIDWTWLQSIPFHIDKHLIKLIQLDSPIRIKIDGRQSKGIIIKS